MQIKNNYQIEWEIRTKFGLCVDKGMGIFNGDTGIIEEINDFAETMTISFDEGRKVEYPFKLLEELSPDGVDDGFGYLDKMSFADLSRASESGTMAAHSTHLPCLCIHGGHCSERDFGGLFYFFMLSCVFSCRMMGVNPSTSRGWKHIKSECFKCWERSNCR